MDLLVNTCVEVLSTNSLVPCGKVWVFILATLVKLDELTFTFDAWKNWVSPVKAILPFPLATSWISLFPVNAWSLKLEPFKPTCAVLVEEITKFITSLKLLLEKVSVVLSKIIWPPLLGKVIV